MKTKTNSSKNRFWLIYGIVSAFICVLTVLGLIGFYRYTGEYESAQPKTCIDAYCNGFEQEARTRLQTLCAEQCGAYEPQEAAIDEVLMPMLGVDYAYRRAGGADDMPPAYIIYTKDQKRELARVTLRESGRSRWFHLPYYEVDRCDWLLDFSGIQSFPVQLTVPADAVVTVNGIYLSYPEDTAEIPYPTAPGEQRTGLPQMRQFTLDGFMRMPQVTAKSADGEDYECFTSGADILLTLPGAHTLQITVPSDAEVKIGQTVLSPEVYAVDKEVPHETDSPFDSAPWVRYEVAAVFEPAAVSASSLLFPSLPLAADGDTYRAELGTGGTVRVETPYGMDCTVRINGVDLAQEGLAAESGQYSFLDGISAFLDAPTVSQTEISGLTCLPQVSVFMGEEEMERLETDDPTQFCYVPKTEEVPEAYRAFIGTFIDALVHYTNMGGQYFGLYHTKVQAEILDGSPAEAYMYEAGYYYAVNHILEIVDSSFEAHDLVRYSDTCFSVIVDYESTVIGQTQFTEQATSKLYYVFSGGRWLVADFAFLYG